MIDEDPYADLKRHALAPGEIVGRRIEPEKIRKRRKQFVMVPWTWVERLAKARSVSTYKVALYILHLNWKWRGQSFTLANGALTEDGVSRYSKWYALQELEQLGLIRVDRRTRKSPVITILP